MCTLPMKEDSYCTDFLKAQKTSLSKSNHTDEQHQEHIPMQQHLKHQVWCKSFYRGF